MQAKKILVVDDDPGNRESIVSLLMASGNQYAVMSGVNGEQGVQIALKTLPQLVIMDWEMPVMNGIEATAKLKEHPETAGIPVIMFTGVKTTTEHLSTALKAGAIDFLRKPVDKVELLARVNSMLLLTEYYHGKIAGEQENARLMQEKMEAEVEYKLRELSTVAMQVAAKNEVLNDLKARLQELNSQLPPEFSAKYRQLVSVIDFNTSSDNYWDDFKTRFAAVHKGFLETLATRCADLTPGETRLCCLLRMNLANKEIAQMLNVSVDAVDKNRYRLRKKLDLDAEVNIVQYLNSL